MPGAFKFDVVCKIEEDGRTLQTSSSSASHFKYEKNVSDASSSVLCVNKQLEEDFIPLEPSTLISESTKPNAPVDPPIQLSREQRSVLESVKKGHSVFFTGSAGTLGHTIARSL